MSDITSSPARRACCLISTVRLMPSARQRQDPQSQSRATQPDSAASIWFAAAEPEHLPGLPERLEIKSREASGRVGLGV